jgi:CHAD domain-containing protein
MPPTSQNGRHPTTFRAKLPVTTVLLLRRARELERQLPLAIEGNDIGVHQARVASRRLREAVPVLAGESKARRKAEKKIRKLTQALGTVREMDVTVQILDEFAQTNALPRNALEDVRGHVIAERDRRRAVMLHRLRRVDTDRIRARLEEASIVAAVTDSAEWRGALSTRVSHRVQRLRHAIEEAGQMYAAEQLHEVRIATKKLRYALELIADARLAPVRPLVNTLKRAQDTLGKLHDFQVIEQHVSAVQAMPPTRRGVHDGGLKVIASSLEDACRHLHGRYIKQVPALEQLLDTCTSTVLPQIARRARRPLKAAIRHAERPTLARRA